MSQSHRWTPIHREAKADAEIPIIDAHTQLICVTDTLPRATWTTVNVRLFPALDATGRADVWLNGAHCGSYRGPIGDRENGARRDGVPVANVQPRFGIYRDWRAETQTIYFSGIEFWNADPAGDPDWGVSAGPQ